MNVRFEIASEKEAGKLAKLLALNSYSVFIVSKEHKIGEEDSLYVVAQVPGDDVVADESTWEDLA